MRLPVAERFNHFPATFRVFLGFRNILVEACVSNFNKYLAQFSFHCIKLTAEMRIPFTLKLSAYMVFLSDESPCFWREAALCCDWNKGGS